jgi:small conductance mechanosensitive channel
MYLTSEGVSSELIEELGDQTGFLVEFWGSIDWRAIGIAAIITALQILVAVIIFFILKKLGRYFIELAFKKHLQENNAIPNRYNTLYNLSKNIYRAVLYFFLVYTILELIGIPVGTLVAGAGVIGLALSLGAQGFVSDIVNGFMILLEKQIDIGDLVELAGVVGTVEDVNLKTTLVKDFDGTKHYIPNRNIMIISNKSRGEMRALIRVRLLPGTDLEQVRQVIQQINDTFIPDNEDITTPPAGVMFVPETAGQTAAQVVMFTKPGRQFATQFEFYEKYVDGLTKAGIELPKINIDTTA